MVSLWSRAVSLENLNYARPRETAPLGSLGDRPGSHPFWAFSSTEADISRGKGK